MSVTGFAGGTSVRFLGPQSLPGTQSFARIGCGHGEPGAIALSCQTSGEAEASLGVAWGSH